MMRPSTLVPLIVVVALGTVVWYLSTRPEAPPLITLANPGTPSTTRTPVSPEEPSTRPALSELAAAPDWSLLEPWQGRLRREDFLQEIENVFSVSEHWRKWFHLGENEVLIETGESGRRFILRFAPDSGPETPDQATAYWRQAAEFPPASIDLPLEGVRIAIDPGHIGGKWAQMEERWFQVGDATPVKEGDMTLFVAALLAPMLEELGAEVTLVRTTNEPVTSLRPEELTEQTSSGNEPIHKLAERLFYRTAEIRARAERVNRIIKPDLVICLHFNAEAWGDPLKPTLVDRHHFHLILNGAYTNGELALADQRFQLVQKIVQRIHPEETSLATAVAASFARTTQLPPFLYEPNSMRAVNIDGNPYLWGRNLLANRLYECPVVFLEPYVMNSKIDHARIQAGDYEGMRPVDGTSRPSIFREYASAVSEGIRLHFESIRPMKLEIPDN